MNNQLDPVARAFYQRSMWMLNEADLSFLVGGAYAFERYTGIARHTKDFDIFVHPRDFDRVLDTLASAGCETDVPFPHWLGKAHRDDEFVDIIFSSGNGVAAVDDGWFEHAVTDHVLDMPARLIPAEEMIWSKAFIMERERYDGADVAHLILACGRELDWRRLLGRFGRRWRVLLSHLILFGFIYPSERAAIPDAVMAFLQGRLQREQAWPGTDGRVCDGTLLSRQQYLPDVTERGYADGRLEPRGEMTAADIEHWTAAILSEQAPAPTVSAPGLAVVHANGRQAPRARRRGR
jgi:hypothetical protein